MSRRKAVVEAYFEGFRRSDHGAILALLTDDVVWDIPGHAHRQGKAAFDREIEHEDSVGSPRLTVDRLVEGDGTVVATGTGEGTHRTAGVHRFAFCTVLSFEGEAIRRVESYVVPLS